MLQTSLDDFAVELEEIDTDDIRNRTRIVGECGLYRARHYLYASLWKSLSFGASAQHHQLYPPQATEKDHFEEPSGVLWPGARYRHATAVTEERYVWMVGGVLLSPAFHSPDNWKRFGVSQQQEREQRNNTSSFNGSSLFNRSFRFLQPLAEELQDVGSPKTNEVWCFDTLTCEWTQIEAKCATLSKLSLMEHLKQEKKEPQQPKKGGSKQKAKHKPHNSADAQSKQKATVGIEKKLSESSPAVPLEASSQHSSPKKGSWLKMGKSQRSGSFVQPPKSTRRKKRAETIAAGMSEGEQGAEILPSSRQTRKKASERHHGGPKRKGSLLRRRMTIGGSHESKEKEKKKQKDPGKKKKGDKISKKRKTKSKRPSKSRPEDKAEATQRTEEPEKALLSKSLYEAQSSRLAEVHRTSQHEKILTQTDPQGNDTETHKFGSSADYPESKTSAKGKRKEQPMEKIDEFSVRVGAQLSFSCYGRPVTIDKEVQIIVDVYRVTPESEAEAETSDWDEANAEEDQNTESVSLHAQNLEETPPAPPQDDRDTSNVKPGMAAKLTKESDAPEKQTGEKGDENLTPSPANAEPPKQDTPVVKDELLDDETACTIANTGTNKVQSCSVAGTAPSQGHNQREKGKERARSQADTKKVLMPSLDTIELEPDLNSQGDPRQEGSPTIYPLLAVLAETGYKTVLKVNSLVTKDATIKRELPKVGHHSLVADDDGNLWLFGGVYAPSSVDPASSKAIWSDELWRFDIAMNTWHLIQTKGPRPRARCSHAALWAPPNFEEEEPEEEEGGATAGIMYIYGGVADDSRELHADIWAYHIDSNQWKQVLCTGFKPAQEGLKVKEPEAGGSEEEIDLLSGRANASMECWREWLFVYGGITKLNAALDQGSCGGFMFNLDSHQVLPFTADNTDLETVSQQIVRGPNCLYFVGGKQKMAKGIQYVYTLPDMCMERVISDAVAKQHATESAKITKDRPILEVQSEGPSADIKDKEKQKVTPLPPKGHGQRNRDDAASSSFPSQEQQEENKATDKHTNIKEDGQWETVGRHGALEPPTSYILLPTAKLKWLRLDVHNEQSPAAYSVVVDATAVMAGPDLWVFAGRMDPNNLTAENSHTLVQYFEIKQIEQDLKALIENQKLLDKNGAGRGVCVSPCTTQDYTMWLMTEKLGPLQKDGKSSKKNGSQRPRESIQPLDAAMETAPWSPMLKEVDESAQRWFKRIRSSRAFDPPTKKLIPWVAPLQSDISSLFNDKLTADIVFEADSKQIYAHQAILSARSLRWRRVEANSLFPKVSFPGESKNTSNKEGTLPLDSAPYVVSVDNYSYAALFNTLEYVYLNKCKFTASSGTVGFALAVEMLELSEQFALHALKEHMEEKLIAFTVSVNCLELLDISVRTNSFRLREKTLICALQQFDYVCKHCKLKEKESFKLLIDYVALVSWWKVYDQPISKQSALQRAQKDMALMAIENYTKKAPDELDLFAGQVYKIITRASTGWWEVENNRGETGWVPANLF